MLFVKTVKKKIRESSHVRLVEAWPTMPNYFLFFKEKNDYNIHIYNLICFKLRLQIVCGADASGNNLELEWTTCLNIILGIA